jgi:hypothetical protein
LVNATAAPQTIELGGVFHKIRGSQDPTVNDGSQVSEVTLPPQDGIILLRLERPATISDFLRRGYASLPW